MVEPARTCGDVRNLFAQDDFEDGDRGRIAEPGEPVQIEYLRRIVRQASFYDPETDPTKALTAAYAEALAKGSGWTKTVNGYPQHFPLDEVVQPREATNEALARENEDLKRRLAYGDVNWSDYTDLLVRVERSAA